MHVSSVRYQQGPANRMWEKQGNARVSCPAKRPEHVICAVNGNLVSIIEMQYESVDNLLQITAFSSTLDVHRPWR